MSAPQQQKPAAAPPCPARIPDVELKAFADGELRGWHGLRVRRHAARCTACRREIERMERITRNLRASEPGFPVNGEPEPLSAALRARLIAAAAATPAAQGKNTVSARPPLWRRQPVLVFGAGGAAAATALFVLVASPWLLTTPLDRNEAPAPNAAGAAGATSAAAPAVAASA